ncbi:hypothetical protein EDD18DRAFT_395880 [Armillaria luteobubalina]|uniref:Nephrocystin 3-like N-terminal domain-containing protein n=1 Tax=Armillaria luteobubalina TaxID=153913 RepID=A0AA39Q307_9AGAR|nr:hypothetical protein EDD18DRAFT_395880 [Armillaria luteobubalina]
MLNVFSLSQIYYDHQKLQLSLMLEEERSGFYYIEDVEVRWIIFRDITRLRLSCATGKIVYKGGTVNIDALNPESKTVWSLKLPVTGSSTMIEFKLYTPRRLMFHKCIGRAQIPIAQISNSDQDEDPFFLFSRTSIPIVKLNVICSEDCKETAAGLVRDAMKPTEPLKRISSGLDRVAAVKRMMDIVMESHPAAKFAWNIVSMGVDILKRQQDMDTQVVKLYSAMLSTYQQASNDEWLQKIASLEPLYESLFKQTIHCAKFLERYAKQGIMGRALNIRLADDIEEFRKGFEDLTQKIQAQVLKENHREVHDHREQYRMDQALLELVPDVKLDPKRECMPGTRRQAIKYLHTWIVTGLGNTLWCRGMAGTGKSSLMATLYGDLTSRAIIPCSFAAFLRYDRNIPAESSSLISNIAYSLCKSSYGLGRAISQVIEEKPWVLRMPITSAKEQFRLLLQDPLRSIHGLADRGPLVVIIDGLDECIVPRDIVPVLAGGFGQDLCFVRLIIASRPLEHIQNVFDATKPAIPIIDLDPSTDSDADRDIQLYIGSRFHDMYEELPSDDSREFRHQCEALHVVDILTHQAKGLFIWAVTVCDFISEFPCESRLKMLLGDRGIAIDSLNTLYRTALGAIVSENSRKDPILREHIRNVLAAIIAAGGPIHVNRIDRAVHRPGNLSVSYVLNKLWSVIQLSENTILPVHQSFYDFLQDPEQCGDEWYIDDEQKQKASDSLKMVDD